MSSSGIVVVALASVACGGATRATSVCEGLVCARDLPVGAFDVSYFVVEGQPIDEPVTLVNGTLRATAGLLTTSSLPLASCEMRVRWRGSRAGETTARAPAIEQVATSRRAIWKVSISGFSRTDLLEVTRSIECPDEVSISPGPSTDHVAGEEGLIAACRPGPRPTAGTLELAPSVDVLSLEPAPGVIVAREGDRLVDACTNTTLLDLAPFGESEVVILLPHPRQRNEAVFASRFSPVPASSQPAVRVKLEREMSRDVVWRLFEGHRFAHVMGWVKEIRHSR